MDCEPAVKSASLSVLTHLEGEPSHFMKETHFYQWFTLTHQKHPHKLYKQTIFAFWQWIINKLLPADLWNYPCPLWISGQMSRLVQTATEWNKWTEKFLWAKLFIFAFTYGWPMGSIVTAMNPNWPQLFQYLSEYYSKSAPHSWRDLWCCCSTTSLYRLDCNGL